jgi:hypothetical protein
MQTRSIKALSEQQIADLKAGRGMGLALAAELNGYPGPVHVLELSDKLGLSAEQKSRIEALFESMKAEAVPLGEKLLAQETTLDQHDRGPTAKYSSQISPADCPNPLSRADAALFHAARVPF